MKYSVVTVDGKETGRSLELPPEFFSVKENEHVVYLAVKQYLAAQRQGTHATKEKSKITASTRKLRKQKGSGFARQGSAKSNILKGGGTTFGPLPRDYTIKVNKKTKRLAKKVMLSQHAAKASLTILAKEAVVTAKTKDFIANLRALGMDKKKTLFIMSSIDRNFVYASRNIGNTKIVTVDAMNVYDLVNAQQLILSEAALPALEKKL